jgi:hypothetical protein
MGTSGDRATRAHHASLDQKEKGEIHPDDQHPELSAAIRLFVKETHFNAPRLCNHLEYLPGIPINVGSS